MGILWDERAGLRAIWMDKLCLQSVLFTEEEKFHLADNVLFAEDCRTSIYGEFVKGYHTKRTGGQ